jgi:hypothetical protein
MGLPSSSSKNGKIPETDLLPFEAEDNQINISNSVRTSNKNNASPLTKTSCSVLFK